MSHIIPYHQCQHIDGFERFSPEIVFKGIILLYNITLNETSAFNQKLVKVYDPENMLSKILRSLSENSSYGDLRLLAEFNGTALNCSLNGEIEKELSKYKHGVVLVHQQINKAISLTANTSKQSEKEIMRTFKSLVEPANSKTNQNVFFKENNRFLFEDLHKIFQRKVQNPATPSSKSTRDMFGGNLFSKTQCSVLERINRVIISTKNSQDPEVDVRIEN